MPWDQLSPDDEFFFIGTFVDVDRDGWQDLAFVGDLVRVCFTGMTKAASWTPPSLRGAALTGTVWALPLQHSQAPSLSTGSFRQFLTLPTPTMVWPRTLATGSSATLVAESSRTSQTRQGCGPATGDGALLHWTMTMTETLISYKQMVSSGTRKTLGTTTQSSSGTTLMVAPAFWMAPPCRRLLPSLVSRTVAQARPLSLWILTTMMCLSSTTQKV
mmetsp:Transcript_1931/g.6919  ORF Transcript_1931/g.6919 Transcript_1931/m.6919 type:complete len:216 (+) Transcript_1931:816-1463(+)